MKKPVAFFIGMTFSATVVSGQVPVTDEKFPGLDTADIPGVEIPRSDTYDGTSLWGYINGGADVYLEYGFLGLRVQEISREGITLKADVYTMEDSPSAMGIFSISTFRCMEKPVEFTLGCLNPYQLQFVKGKYYVSIQNDEGNPGSMNFMKEVGKALETRLASNPPAFPFDLVNAGDTSFDWWYAEGPLGIQNGMPAWGAYMQGLEGFRLLLLRPGSGAGWVALLEDMSSEGMTRWLENYRNSGGDSNDLRYEQSGTDSWILGSWEDEATEAEKLYMSIMDMTGGGKQ